MSLQGRGSTLPVALDADSANGFAGSQQPPPAAPRPRVCGATSPAHSRCRRSWKRTWGGACGTSALAVRVGTEVWRPGSTQPSQSHTALCLPAWLAVAARTKRPWEPGAARACAHRGAGLFPAERAPRCPAGGSAWQWPQAAAFAFRRSLGGCRLNCLFPVRPACCAGEVGGDFYSILGTTEPGEAGSLMDFPLQLVCTRQGCNTT